MQNKPSSKVIQSITNKSTAVWTVLCEDGSIWSKTTGGDWVCILEAPTQPKSDLPEVGSRWRYKTENTIQLEILAILHRPVAFQVEFRNGEIAERDLEQLLELYEPIPTQSDNKE